MKVLVTHAAEDDLASIHAHHAERSVSTAGKVVGTILRAINGLEMFPLIGKPGAVPGTRERFVRRYPYRVIYHIDELNQTIEVWRVLHGARHWPSTE